MKLQTKSYFLPPNEQKLESMLTCSCETVENCLLSYATEEVSNIIIIKYSKHIIILRRGDQIWKTQQWPQNWKRSVFIPSPKKGNAKEFSNYCTIALISHEVFLPAESHGQRSMVMDREAWRAAIYGVAKSRT